MRYIKLILLLIISIPVTSQTAEEPDENLYESLSRLPQEKIYVHTDKPYYLTGENIWFKVYVMDASFHTLSKISNVAYVELLDNKNQSVFRSRLLLDNGTASGQFYINAKIGTGVYYLRAYTALMRNFPEQYFFEREINLINPFQANFDLIPEVSDYQLSIFPEGGNLVTNLENKVTVHLRDDSGENRKTSIHIYDGDSSLLQFETNSMGIGSFSFKPQSNKNYKAVFNIDGKRIEKELPQAKSSSAGLNYIKTETGINVVLYNNYDGELKLIVNQRGIPSHIQEITFSGGLANASLENLPNGVNEIVVLDKNDVLKARRLVFMGDLKSEPGTIAMDTRDYEKREKVLAQVDLSGLDVDAKNLSVSVYRAYKPFERNDHNPSVYMDLRSELNTSIGGMDEIGSDEIDNLLMLNRESRHDWSQVKNPDSDFKFQPELKAPLISGSLSSDSLDDQWIYAIFSGKQSQLYAFKPDETGRFSFEISPNILGADLLFWSEERNLSNATIKVDNPFAEPEGERAEKYLKFYEEDMEFLEDYALNLQVENAYAAENDYRGISTAKPFNYPFYGKPDESYVTEDYTKFPELEEIFKEYVRLATVRKQKNIRRLHVKGIEYKSINFKKPAFVMVDGIPVNNLDYLWQLEPEEVQQIDIISRRFTLGGTSLNGVINVITYKGNLGGLELPEDVYKTTYEPTLKPSRYTSPDYSNDRSSRLPDFRNVLLWEPYPELNNGQLDIEFYTSDAVGNYMISVVGFDNAGEVIHLQQEITVIDNDSSK